MSMGGEVGSGAGIAPHPNPLPKGARGPMVHGVIFSLSLWERAGMRASARTFSPITPPQSPSHQSISHASNWWLIWVRITRGERIT